MQRVTVRQLQVFVAVAEQLSLARVAEQLRLTPSAVSFQIRQVEQQAGFALFERIGRGVALTQAGLLLLTHARRVMRSLEDADQALLALNGADGGRIRLGLVSTAKYIVPHMIARFRTQCPGAVVTLTEGNRREVGLALAGGTVDLAVMGQPASEELAAARFADHPTVVVAAPGHALAGRRRIPPAALAPEWFIVREEGAGTRALTDAFFQGCGFTPRIAMESSSNEMIKQSVIAGMGVALLSRHTISLELSLGLLVTLPVTGFPLMRAWHVVQRRSMTLLPVQARLRDFLVGQGQSIIGEIGRAHAALRPAAPVTVAQAAAASP